MKRYFFFFFLFIINIFFCGGGGGSCYYIECYVGFVVVYTVGVYISQELLVFCLSLIPY